MMFKKFLIVLSVVFMVGVYVVEFEVDLKDLYKMVCKVLDNIFVCIIKD